LQYHCNAIAKTVVLNVVNIDLLLKLLNFTKIFATNITTTIAMVLQQPLQQLFFMKILNYNRKIESKVLNENITEIND
jgi:hypothetical protein